MIEINRVRLDRGIKGVRAEWHLLKLLGVTIFSHIFLGNAVGLQGGDGNNAISSSGNLYITAFADGVSDAVATALAGAGAIARFQRIEATALGLLTGSGATELGLGEVIVTATANGEVDATAVAGGAITTSSATVKARMVQIYERAV